jgi:hypothetical protein
VIHPQNKDLAPFVDVVKAMHWLTAAEKLSICTYGALSIAVAKSGNLAPQCLDLYTGRLEVLKAAT